MRVTPSILFRQALADLSRTRERLSVSQEQAASGLRINRPSDDPVGAGAVRMLESARRASEQFERNATRARARVSASETAVAESVDLLIRARELALQGANGTLDAGGRAQIAVEIESLHAALLAEANGSFDGARIFAGHSSDTAPFVASGPFPPLPPAPSVAFVGDSNPIEVEIEEGVTVPVSFDGARIFQGDGDGDGFPDAGREDLFAVLGDLRDALVTNDPVATAALLPRLDAGLDQLQTERTRMGAVETRLEVASARLAGRGVDLEKRISEIQDADLAEVVSRMVREETALQASLETMSRILSPTLMDFLR